jgi:biofilm PGA synthesis N-glycosyltransferase PgaC
MTTPERLRIAIVVSFLNEERHLPRLLASLERQTEPPDQLLLVDDGSSDDSIQIAERFAGRVPYATLLRRPPRPPATDRLADAPELQAFVWGTEQIDGDWDVMAKMDGDLDLPRSLCRDVRDRFEADPELGITGSDLAVVGKDGVATKEHNPSYHVRGPNKFYRRACLEAISPLPTFLGWDTIDDLRARAAGWKTESFTPTDGLAIHLRPTGLHDGRLRAYRRWGLCAWTYGAHPAWVLVGAARRAARPPLGLAAASYLYGWAAAALRGYPRAEPETIAFRRREDLGRLRAALFGGDADASAPHRQATAYEYFDPDTVMTEFSPSRPTAPLYLLQLVQRARARAFTAVARSSLGSLGRGSVLQPPARLVGPHEIHLGANVQLGPGSWLQVLTPQGRITIGDRTQSTGTLFVSVVHEVRIGRSVLFARDVYIADHEHAHDDTTRPVNVQGVSKIAPVVIEDGAWLAQGVIVLPGVTIGAGAVIGANSVVRDDVPPHSIAVGAPARVVRRIGGAAER